MATALKIDTIFRAVDQATAPVKKMQKSMVLFSEKTRKSLKISKKSIDQFDRKVKRMANNAIRNVKFMAAGIGVAGVAGVQKFAKSADELAKTSRQIGVSVESLQSLRFAADRQGVSSEKLTGSLQKLNKNVGDLRAGTGALTTFLNKSNPALATQLKNVKSNEQAFNLLLDEINKLPNSADKAALAQAAFGRSGQDIIKMAEVGSKGIKDLKKEFESYGGVISTETANSAEKLIDAQTNLKAALGGVWNIIASKIIPVVTKVTDKINKFVSENKVLIQQKLSTVFNVIGKSVSFAWKAIKKIYTIFKKLSPVLLPIVAAFTAYATVMKVAALAQGVMTAAQWALNAAMTANPVGLIIAGIAALIALIVLLVKKIKKTKKGMAFLKGFVYGFKKTFMIVFKVIKFQLKVIKKVFSAIFKAISFIVEAAWTGIKKGWDLLINHIKKTFFTFADVFLTIFGTIAEGVIKVAAKIGKFLGKDVSGLESTLNKINDIQEKVRSQSYIGDVQDAVKGKKYQVQSKETNRQEIGRGQLDINFANAPIGMSTKTNGKRMNGIKLNTGNQPALIGGW